MKYCVIDLDDVIGPFSVILNPALNRTFGKQVDVEQWTDFDMTSHYGINHEQLFEVIINQGLLPKISPYPGAQRALQRLVTVGILPLIVTSRDYHPQAFEITQAWLAQHELPYHKLIIKPEGQTKAQVAMAEAGSRIEFAADDFANNLDHIRESGLTNKLGLIDQPWNRHRKEFVWGRNRFRSLIDFVDHVLTAENQPAHA